MNVWACLRWLPQESHTSQNLADNFRALSSSVPVCSPTPAFCSGTAPCSPCFLLVCTFFHTHQPWNWPQQHWQYQTQWDKFSAHCSIQTPQCLQDFRWSKILSSQEFKAPWTTNLATQPVSRNIANAWLVHWKGACITLQTRVSMTCLLQTQAVSVEFKLLLIWYLSSLAVN